MGCGSSNSIKSNTKERSETEYNETNKGNTVDDSNRLILIYNIEPNNTVSITNTINEENNSDPEE
ncbi:MAG: hypothetical protein MJ252_19900, partial [archaeon]|nr:hypothetical protein [archaeon]